MDLSKFIENLKDDNFYYSDYDFVTNSQLGTIEKDVRTYKFLRDNPQYAEKTSAMNFGNAYHVAVLEPEEFNNKIVVFDGASRNSKAYKEFVGNNPEAPVIILTKEYDRIMRMQDKLFSHNEVCDMLVPEGLTEVPSAWLDKDTGVYCKGKVDFMNGSTLIDLKTTQDCTPQGFAKSCQTYGYDRQAAFYLDGFEAKEFYFIAQNKEAPYNVGIHYAGRDFVEFGRAKYKNLLETYKRYFITEEDDPDGFIIQNVL